MTGWLGFVCVPVAPCQNYFRRATPYDRRVSAAIFRPTALCHLPISSCPHTERQPLALSRPSLVPRVQHNETHTSRGSSLTCCTCCCSTIAPPRTLGKVSSGGFDIGLAPLLVSANVGGGTAVGVVGSWPVRGGWAEFSKGPHQKFLASSDAIVRRHRVICVLAWFSFSQRQRAGALCNTRLLLLWSECKIY